MSLTAYVLSPFSFAATSWRARPLHDLEIPFRMQFSQNVVNGPDYLKSKR